MSDVESLDTILDGNPKSGDILRSFEHYAETDIIDYDIAANILDKAYLSPQELDSAYAHMQTGLVNQILEGKINNALPYLQLMDHIAEIMVEKCKITYVLDDSEKEDLLLQLKSKLFEANKQKIYGRADKALLDNTVSIFREYAQKTNPKAFDENTIFEEIILPGWFSP
ncbi:MAG: hypothetical protein U9O53_06115 [archaeon]|nr:hypothetical protein [archaeon]